MVFVYVIESISDQTWYTGIALNTEVRLKEHNAGKNRFTKGHLPWKIIYSETHPEVLVPCPTDVDQAGIPVSGTMKKAIF